MTSFFPFSSSSSSVNTITPTLSDDPHLQVTVTPSSSAFYAGEPFSVRITLRNTRLPNNDARTPITPDTAPPTAEVGTATSAYRGMPSLEPRTFDGVELTRRKGQIGGYSTSHSHSSNHAVKGLKSPIPDRLTEMGQVDYNGNPYSPGANPASRAGWPREGDVVIRSPETWRRNNGDVGKGKSHERRTRSWALGNKGMSPQEMVWALSGQATPPPLPFRRPQTGSQIPTSHPHSRKISITTPILPPLDDSHPGSPSELPSIPESSQAGPSRPKSRSTNSSSNISSSSASSSRSRLPLDGTGPEAARASIDGSGPRRSPRTPLGNNHSRAPSYQNAYGAAYLSTPLSPPPTHPYSRARQPTEPRGNTTVLWAYTRLIGQFHPSNQYIPPDPLLPLRSLLLHQPVGSGSLSSPMDSSSNPDSAQHKRTSSRWQLSFGTGAIGHKSQPSLTGSLFGLAKELVTGGTGGTLEEERRRVWQMKDLPVLETARSLLGVDIRLKEGEAKEFSYTIVLPKNLPPAHKGRAYRFSYDLIVSLTVALPGQGNRQKSKDIHIPIRIWANVSIANPLRSYDVLKPVMQTKDEAKVDTDPSSPNSNKSTSSKPRRSSAGERARLRAGDTAESLQTYASHLLETVDLNQTPDINGRASPRSVPLSPSRADARIASLHPTVFSVDGHPRKSTDSSRVPAAERLEIPNGHGRSRDGSAPAARPRQGSFVSGDDELVAEASEEGGCGQAVEVLSRHSTKSSYDIAKDGEIVAVLTLVKTTFRLGETVLGVVSFNNPDSTRRVLKVSAFLESHELIPEPLLPLSASSAGHAKHPPLSRLHAEHRSAYTVNTCRLSFSLDIPSDSTPDFAITAGDERHRGGLQWKLRIAFLVSAPAKKHHDHNHNHNHGHGHDHDRSKQSQLHSPAPTPTPTPTPTPVHLLPLPESINDPDNILYAASTGLSPLTPVMEGGKQVAWGEMKVETVECEVPIKVLAGNTAFVVRPSTFIV